MIAQHPNAFVFVVGLLCLCASLSAWSWPLAGSVFGGVLMLVAIWPFLWVRRS